MNKVILMGRMTKDAELRYTQSQIPVASFTVAVDRFAKKGEERKADFINCTAWRGTAEFISKHFTKGQMIAIVGKMQVENYEKDGQKRTSTTVVVDEAFFCGSKGEAKPQTNDDGFMEVSNAADLPF